MKDIELVNKETVRRIIDSPRSKEQMLRMLESIEPVTKQKVYTKAYCIMALHRLYGCNFAVAEEAHNKALDYIRSKSMLKG